MPKGEGKGWAKGRTAANDPRVAKNAMARTGLLYVRRTPPEECRWPISSRTTLPLEWSEAMAYIVGLTATDGCLVTGRRKVSFKSMDRDLVATYLRLLGRTNRIKEQKGSRGGIAYFTEFADAQLYEWFLSVGLMPRKSLRLGAIDVPDDHLFPLLRGLLDGDGTIANFVHHPTPTTAPGYTYERFWLFFTSASRDHVEWIRRRAGVAASVKGYIDVSRRKLRQPFYRLKYGNREAIELLQRMYPTDDVPKLERKWRLWDDYRRRRLAPVRKEGFEPSRPCEQ